MLISRSDRRKFSLLLMRNLKHLASSTRQKIRWGRISLKEIRYSNISTNSAETLSLNLQVSSYRNKNNAPYSKLYDGCHDCCFWKIHVTLFCIPGLTTRLVELAPSSPSLISINNVTRLSERIFDSFVPSRTKFKSEYARRIYEHP